MCIGFHLLVSQITTNLRAQNNTNVLSDSSGNQKSEMAFAGLKSRCQQCCVPSEAPGENPFLRLFQFLEVSNIP